MTGAPPCRCHQRTGPPIRQGEIPARWGSVKSRLADDGLILVVGLATWPLGVGATVVGVLAAWAYSAEPVRLKRRAGGAGLVGSVLCRACHGFTGAAVLSAGAPSMAGINRMLYYGIGAHGIMTLNDFKALKVTPNGRG